MNELYEQNAEFITVKTDGAVHKVAARLQELKLNNEQ
jgi:hypothetical protein